MIYKNKNTLNGGLWIVAASLLLSAGAALTGCGQQEGEEDMVWLSTGFHEPSTLGLEYIWSEDGLHWDTVPGHWLVPAVGTQQVMRDPSIICVRDTFRLVWTAGWKHDLGFGYSWSTDLQHWSPQEFIAVMQPMDSACAQRYGCGFDPMQAYANAEGQRSAVRLDSIDGAPVQVWAPELFYDADRDRTLIVWASCVPGAFADVLEEHGNNHRLYYTETSDWQHFAPTRLFIDPGFSVIDGTLVDNLCVEPTGTGRRMKPEEATAGKPQETGEGYRYTAVLKDNTRPCRNLRIAFSNSLEGPWTAASEEFTPQFCEGPTVVRTADGWYNVYYDAYKMRCYGNMRTQDFRTFTDWTDSVSVPEGHKHGTAIRVNRRILKNLLPLAQ